MKQWFVDVNKPVILWKEKCSIKEFSKTRCALNDSHYSDRFEKIIFTGSTTFVTGVFPVKFGGDIAFLFGIAWVERLVSWSVKIQL